ncbi:DUF3465 domain-containing protein [Methylobacillus flagellatus]|uniref:DUF3465 domain-containing protein n=1 Tax=Methylobacillus flagellatus TaxID=405 RepID=UPI0010F96BC6|nr:DUF3465 domain-containing protein [Methylobacillus flagellatus]
MMRLLLILVMAVIFTVNHHNASSAPDQLQQDGVAAIAQAYAERRGNLQVQAEGVVSKLLKDDLQGSRHQRFILRLHNGQTVLVAHNIDLAPRITGLKAGDKVAFYGEYEWNNKGGVIHWTHHDPQGRHPAGWLRHNGHTYQ